MFEFAKPKAETKISINPIILLQTVALLLGIYFLYSISSILTLIFLAFIVMVALNPSVTRLQRKTKMPRLFSIVVVYIFFIVSVVGATGLLIPPLADQFTQLIKLVDAPFVQDHLAQFSTSFGDITNINALFNQLGRPANIIFSAVTSTVSSLFTFFTLLVLSFYLILEREHLHRKISWLTKKESDIALTKEFIDSIEKQLGGWVRGELILMSIIGAMTFVGLSLLGVPYAVPLALFAGMMEALPNLGPTISAVPAIAIAAFQVSPWHGGAVLVFYIVIQQLENNLLVPKVMQDNAHISPLASIVSILIGFKLGGVTGGLLAVPIYIVLRTGLSFWQRAKLPEKKI